MSERIRGGFDREVRLSPGAGRGTMRLPGARHVPETVPGPDDHLVEPGTRQEMFRGQLLEVAPALPGHGDVHSRLDMLVQLHIAPGYVASSDLLTRRGADSDFATDACVRKAGHNPETGQRYLEELAFEVVYKQRAGHITERAREVVKHGVRRLIAIFVRDRHPGGDIDGSVKAQVKEWSVLENAWVVLDPDSTITDSCLRRPLPVKALMDAAEAANAAARVLVAHSNPVIEELAAKNFHDGREAGLRDGREAGLRDGREAGLQAQRRTLLQLLAHRDIALDAAQRARIAACDDLDTLAQWCTRAFHVDSAAALFS